MITGRSSAIDSLSSCTNFNLSQLPLQWHCGGSPRTSPSIGEDLCVATLCASPLDTTTTLKTPVSDFFLIKLANETTFNEPSSRSSVMVGVVMLKIGDYSFQLLRHLTHGHENA